MPLPALVIDDDLTTRTVLEKILSRNGFDVAVAGDGEEGLAIAARLHPALVVTDLLLPKADGPAVCARIRSNPSLAGTKIVVVTGIKNPTFQREARNSGADAVLEKPVDADALMKVVRTLIPGV
ncbi:MAG: response regulator [Acidobacteriota bacterium]|nr:response regulator [Acidobacteriota bacterium]